MSEPTHGIARERYRQYFDTISADEVDCGLLDEAPRLRYRVYCIGNAFDDPVDNPGGLNCDSDDGRAVRCLLFRKRGRSRAGTVRLILPDQSDPSHSFALQVVCSDPVVSDQERLPVHQAAEVSRVSVSKHFRNRQGDRFYPQSSEPGDQQDERRVIPNMALGLIEGQVQMSLDNGRFNWCAVMERPLLPLLARLGIRFGSIGLLVGYHGRRQPCRTGLHSLLANMQEERPDVWSIVTDGGRRWDRLGHVVACRPE